MKGFFYLLTTLLLIACVLALGIGAIAISPQEIINIILHRLSLGSDVGFSVQQENVFWAIRLPRVFLAVLVGATLAVSGVGMQGLFRNPLADPGLIGIGSGASLAAVTTIVLGASLFARLPSIVGMYSLNIATFIGAIAAMLLVYRISRQGGKTNIGIMLLAGIAINSLGGALTGFVTILANEQQLRSLTFWSLGSLGGANWMNILSILPFCLASIVGIPFFARQLNAFALGEGDAAHLGIKTEKLKNSVMLLAALGVGACVSVTGMIGFIGLVVPHIVRMSIGPEHKKLIIASAIGGAILLVIADLISRTIAIPVEVPIGIITSIAGGPFFLFLLMREKKKQVLI